MEPSINRIDVMILIRSLVAQQTEPYTLPELMRDFKKEVGYPMPTFGHRTALDFLRSMPETLKVIFENRSCYIKLGPGQDSLYIGSAIHNSGLLSDDENNKPSTSKQPNDPQSQNSGLLSDDENNKPSTSKQPNDPQSQNWGELQKVDFVKQGQKKKKKKKVKKTTTYTSIRDKEKLAALLEEMLQQRDAVLCLKCLSIEGNVDSIPIIDRCLSRITLRESDLPVINLTSYIAVGDDIECSVTEVYNPHKFFLHLKRFRDDLTRLMKSLQYFYSEYSVRYAVKKFQFKPTHICAALCALTPDQSEWYRAKIVEYGDKMSTVFLVDYGTTVQTRTCDLKFLDRVFGKLPVQAVRGKLATIKPRDGKRWLMDCRKRFYSLVFDEELVARVVHIDSKKHCLGVVLSRGEIGELRVDKALIEEKLAVAFSNSDEPESISLVDYDSKSRKGMLQPEVIGRNRKPRVQLPNPDEGCGDLPKYSNPYRSHKLVIGVNGE